jgi:hypothetical protein
VNLDPQTSLLSVAVPSDTSPGRNASGSGAESNMQTHLLPREPVGLAHSLIDAPPSAASTVLDPQVASLGVILSQAQVELIPWLLEGNVPVFTIAGLVEGMQW